MRIINKLFGTLNPKSRYRALFKENGPFEAANIKPRSLFK